MKHELTKNNNGVYNISIENLQEITYLLTQTLEFENSSDAKNVTKISINGYDIHSNNFSTETTPISINAPAFIKSSTKVNLTVHGNFHSNEKVYISYKLLDDITQHDFKDGIGKYINENPFSL